MRGACKGEMRAKGGGVRGKGGGIGGRASASQPRKMNHEMSAEATEPSETQEEGHQQRDGAGSAREDGWGVVWFAHCKLAVVSSAAARSSRSRLAVPSCSSSVASSSPSCFSSVFLAFLNFRISSSALVYCATQGGCAVRRDARGG